MWDPTDPIGMATHIIGESYMLPSLKRQAVADSLEAFEDAFGIDNFFLLDLVIAYGNATAYRPLMPNTSVCVKSAIDGECL
jgi:hypothetical protein